MRVIDLSLRKYERLKVAYDSLDQENTLLYYQQGLKGQQVLDLQDSKLLLEESNDNFYTLLASKQAERDAWRQKARSRWWTSAGLGVLTILATGFAISH